MLMEVGVLELISVTSLTLALYLKEGPVKIEEVPSIDLQIEILAFSAPNFYSQ